MDNQLVYLTKLHHCVKSALPKHVVGAIIGCCKLLISLDPWNILIARGKGPMEYYVPETKGDHAQKTHGTILNSSLIMVSVK